VIHPLGIQRWTIATHQPINDTISNNGGNKVSLMAGPSVVLSDNKNEMGVIKRRKYRCSK